MMMNVPENLTAAVDGGSVSGVIANNNNPPPPSKRIKTSSEDEKSIGAVVSSTESSRVSSPSIIENTNATTTTTTTATTGNNQDDKKWQLIQNTLRLLMAPLPSSLLAFQEKKKELSTFKELWMGHGFRTSMVTSPKPAVSVYLESCRVRHDNNHNNNINNNNNNDDIDVHEEGREYLLYILGMHPLQKPSDIIATNTLEEQPQQKQQQNFTIEEIYQTAVKDIYCLLQFCNKMRCVRDQDMKHDQILSILQEWERSVAECIQQAILIVSPPPTSSSSSVNAATILANLSSKTPEILSNLISTLMNIDHSLHKEQLLHEYKRIEYQNCTLSNACLQRFLTTVNYHGNNTKTKNNNGEWIFQTVHYKASPPGKYLPKYERITIHLNDPSSSAEEKQEGDYTSVGQFIFLPCLTLLLRGGELAAPAAAGAADIGGATGGDTCKVGSSSSTNEEAKNNCNNNKVKKSLLNAGVQAVIHQMVETTWKSLLRHGYYVDEERKRQLGPELEKYYESGIMGGRDASMPLLLNAHFHPTYALSLYLKGTAGAGKSSLVRNIFPAINSSISQYTDPELLVRFVKQNLNKPFQTLQLELDLRPNNNDYSVMSIIQGRRMTLTQSKPGLVLVALEEMPSDVVGGDPKQSDVAKLLSMRFSGRKGEFREGSGVVAPRNSEKRGISGDATIITVFTSNYDLEPQCFEALQRLEMFKNLKSITVAPVAGEDRKSFALSYLKQRVEESLAPQWKGAINITLDVPCGDGDIRPLVRYLRLLSFYIHAMVRDQAATGAVSLDVHVKFDTDRNITTVTNVADGKSMQLKPGSFQNLYAVTPLTLDSRASSTVNQLMTRHPNLQNSQELSQILEFYFSKTLAPAVILSHNQELLRDLTTLLSESDGVYGIKNIDPSKYKMMKSLYDPSDTPNLRDDILQILHEGGGASSINSNNSRFVAVELKCYSSDAQLQIREIIEDTPSMTAFSTEKSALYKDGLMFCVYVEGDITPEIQSRASLII